MAANYFSCVNLTAAERFYPLIADLLQTYLKYITIYITLLSEISRFQKNRKIIAILRNKTSRLTKQSELRED